MEKISPEAKKIAMIIAPFGLILLTVLIFSLLHDNGNDTNNSSKTVDNQPILEKNNSCPYTRVDDTLVFVRTQIDSLYTVTATQAQKAQNYDCICKFLPLAHTEGRLIIREQDGDLRITLKKHIESPSAVCLEISSVEFEPQKVKIVAVPTNKPLFQTDNNNTPNQLSAKTNNAPFRLPTSFAGNIQNKRAQLNLSKLKQEGDAITFRFNLLSAANPLHDQQGSLFISTQQIKLNRLGEGKFEQQGDKVILRMAGEAISFESIN